MPVDLQKMPRSIAEAVEMMTAGFTDEEKEALKSHPEQHFFFGRAIRNGWNLWWPESAIKRDAVVRYRLAMADDLYGLIIAWAEANLNGKKFDPEAQAQHYHEHWAKSNTTSLEQGGYNEDGTVKPETMEYWAAYPKPPNWVEPEEIALPKQKEFLGRFYELPLPPQVPEWRRDKHGWPIELTKGKPFKNLIRIIVQNLRKALP